MTIHVGFRPDSERARSLDERMHTELGASLRHVCDESRGVVEFDEHAMDRLIRSLGGGARFEPQVFGAYYALVAAIFDQDRSNAEAWFDRLSKARPCPDRRTEVKPLGDPRRSEKSALYQSMMMEQSSSTPLMMPPDDETARRFEARFRRGMELMERAIPSLAGEIGEIVREVVCVVANPESDTIFDGGSHYQLWGGLFLNSESHPTPHAVVEVVAHESAHSLLFGLCTDEPLVYNDDEARYPSPLREDLRPMDGIYHATFVSARMHWAMSRLIESGLLSDEDRRSAEEAREVDREHFEAGHEVVAEHAELSEVGRGLMDGARKYMDKIAR